MATAQPTAHPESPAPATSVPRREAVRIPYAAPSLGSLPLWLTYDGGYFEREGLEVTMDYVASGTTLAQALLSGDVSLASAGQETAIVSGVQGGDVVVVGVSLERALFWVSANTSVRAPEDLRGKRLAVSRFGSASDTVARYYLPTVGLQPERDVAILQLGGNPEMVAALETGATDAAILSPPAVFQARRLGAPPLADLGDLDLQFYQSALVTTRRFLGERPEAMRRVARAYAAAWPLLQDENAALASLQRYTGETDQELLLETYHAGLRRFPASPVPGPKAIQQGLEQLAVREPAALGFRPEQFIVPEYMAEAVADVGR
jgi:NitT/TauT family transport system substrate-binding protein